LWSIDRDEKGYTRALKVIEIDGVREMCENGAKLGDLWMEGFFNK